MVEEIKHQNDLFAIIVRSSFNKPGITFFTSGEWSQQMAYMNHPKGKVIEPHVHNPVKREVHYTQEVLLIKKGKLRVDFYLENQEYLESRILSDGDLILLMTGGHGFEILEDLEMIEVKQGPYAGDQDTTLSDQPSNTGNNSE